MTATQRAMPCYARGVAVDDDARLRCPACGEREVVAEPGRASACLPFPPLESLVCARCGNTGTRLRLRERDLVQWTRGG